MPPVFFLIYKIFCLTIPNADLYLVWQAWQLSPKTTLFKMNPVRLE